MVLTVNEAGPNIDRRVTGKDTVFETGLDSLVHRLDVFTWNTATRDFVDEFVSAARTCRLECDLDYCKLTRTTRLLDVSVFHRLDSLCDGLAIRHLRLADCRIDVELTLHTVDKNFQVQLTHSGNDRLCGFLIGAHAERGVFV